MGKQEDSELEEKRLNLLAEIAFRVLVKDYENADIMCDYYRLLFGELPGEDKP